ncbi:MAG: regulatory iron-sulfur-containing complex subunit RicT [Gemmatimonadaceae bacterium]
MPQHLIEVAFKGNRKEFFLWEAEEPPRLREAVIVEADRGEDLGRVHALGEQASLRCRGCAHGHGAAGTSDKRALRVASADDERRHAELRAQDEAARRKAMERVKANGLVMKLTDAEWRWDRKKLTLYFTAEKRVDFRNLVRELAAMFRTRIELKQIGVRDEARRLDGIGRCGRQYCSAAWLPELRPVNLGVAKDQRLSLNPSQISGACGRLMCSLRYEHEFYVQARKRFPKEGRPIRTAKGEEKVVANDIFNDRVTLRGLDGESRVVPLAALRREMAEAAAAGGAEAGAYEADDGAAIDEGDLPESSGEGYEEGAFDTATPAVSAPRARADAPRPRTGGAPPRAGLRGPAPRGEAAAPPSPPSGEETAEGDESAAGAAEGPEAAERRARRRRGRRGGRRTRGETGAPGAARESDESAGGPGDAPPAPGDDSPGEE